MADVLILCHVTIENDYIKFLICWYIACIYFTYNLGRTSIYQYYILAHMLKRGKRHNIVAVASVWLKLRHFEYYSIFLGGHQLKYFILSPDMAKHRNVPIEIIFI